METECSGNLIGEIGELVEALDVKQIRWKFSFDALSKTRMHYHKSDSFTFANIDWYLCIFAGGHQYAVNSDACPSIFLVQELPGDVDGIDYSLGLEISDGSVMQCKGGILDGTESRFSLLHGDYEFCSRAQFYNECIKDVPPTQTALTVVCTIWQSDPQDKESSSKDKLGLKVLSEDLEAAFVDGKAPDLTLTVKEKKYHVHKPLLSARSTVLAAMLKGNRTEIDIPDCDEESFGHLLKYLYSGRAVKMSFECARQVYFTARKFEAEELKSFCARCMANNLTVESFTDIVIHAEEYNEVELFTAAQKFFNNNFKKIFLLEKWVALMHTSHELASKLIQNMACAINPEYY